MKDIVSPLLTESGTSSVTQVVEASLPVQRRRVPIGQQPSLVEGEVMRIEGRLGLFDPEDITFDAAI